MLIYSLKRIGLGLATVYFIATITFFAMHSVPGNPLATDKAVNAETRANLNRKYGLDKPLMVQYAQFMANLARGDLGLSFTQRNRSVNDIISAKFLTSAQLGMFALLIATTGGILWGALTAIYRNRWPDMLIMVMVILCISIPGFVMATLSQMLIVGIKSLTKWNLPIAGWGDFNQMIVPSLILGLGTMAFLTRLMRSSMLEVLQSDYIRTAKAKGLSSTRIFFRHQLRNAILPVITMLGPTIASITVGSFVIESIFAIPGLGKEFILSVQQSDYTVIMGTTVFYGAFLVAMVLCVDLLYGLIDPRIRLGKKS